MRHKTYLISVFSILILSACGESPDTHAGQPLTHRRAAFRKILLAFEPMGSQLKEKKYDADRLIEQARSLSTVKDGPWPYFGDGTNYPPTHARATVWSTPDQFGAARQRFLKATEALVEAAESRDEHRVAAAYEAVHDSCQNCHQAFKD